MITARNTSTGSSKTLAAGAPGARPGYTATATARAAVTALNGIQNDYFGGGLVTKTVDELFDLILNFFFD